MPLLSTFLPLLFLAIGAAFDRRCRKVPPWLYGGLAMLWWLLPLFYPAFPALSERLIRLLFSSLLFFFLFVAVLVSEHVLSRRLLGGGDLKLFFVLSLYDPLSVFLPSLLVSLFLALLGRSRRKNPSPVKSFPLVPYLFLGYYAVRFFLFFSDKCDFF